MDDFRSPLARKPPLRVDIPRNPFGQSPSVPNRHDGGGPAGASGAGANGTHGANNPGFAHEPVKTPVTPVEDSSRMVPHSEMFSDVSPAALLGDQVARLRLEQGSRGVDVRRPPRAPPTHHDRDEGGGGEVVIDIPVDVSPYMEMFMRPAPPSQGRVLCRVEVKQQKNGNTLYEMVRGPRGGGAARLARARARSPPRVGAIRARARAAHALGRAHAERRRAAPLALR